MTTPVQQKVYYVTNGGAIGDLKRPEVLPVEGQVLRVLRPFGTLGDRIYVPGDKLVLNSQTQEAPHGFLSSLGNWEVSCPFTTSIWSNIEHCIAIGLLE